MIETTCWKEVSTCGLFNIIVRHLFIVAAARLSLRLHSRGIAFGRDTALGAQSRESGGPCRATRWRSYISPALPHSLWPASKKDGRRWALPLVSLSSVSSALRLADYGSIWHNTV